MPARQEPNPHPAKAAGCTKAQIKAFEKVCVGWDSGIHPKTADALIQKGLIVRETQTVGRDCLGPIEIYRYHVPLPIHFAWCEWCGDQPDEDELMADSY